MYKITRSPMTSLPVLSLTLPTVPCLEGRYLCLCPEEWVELAGEGGSAADCLLLVVLLM
jgi:hypothetical protein